MRRVTIVATVGVVAAILVGWFLVVTVPSWFGPRARPSQAAAPPAEAPVRKIRARLFYVSQDGLRLVGADRDVPYGATPVEQTQALVAALLDPPPPPLLAPLPAGTSLRSVYLTDAGDAYVDLSKDATSSHTGGSLDELFSVYAIVNTVTANLPAVQRVQLLVDGKEVDSLAGHIDLRQPLPRSNRWLEMPPVETPAAAPTTEGMPSGAPRPAAPAPATPSPTAAPPAR